MYTNENPYFNTIDKILLGFWAFITMWIFLKAFVDWCDGNGPYGWRTKQYRENQARRGYKRRRATTPPRGLRRRRYNVTEQEQILDSESSHSSSGYTSESEHSSGSNLN